MQARLPAAWSRALLLALAGGALALAASSSTLHNLLIRLLAAAGPTMAAHPVLGATVFVALSALSAMLAFFSAMVIVPIAVFTWGQPLSMTLLWLGWTLGGMFAYGIGRSLGRPIVVALISSSALERFENRISNRLPFGLILLFQFAVPSEVPGYLLGLVRYPFGKFMLALSLVELPFAVATIYLGASFLDRRVGVLIGLAAVGTLASGWALRSLQRRLPTQS